MLIPRVRFAGLLSLSLGSCQTCAVMLSCREFWRTPCLLESCRVRRFGLRFHIFPLPPTFYCAFPSCTFLLVRTVVAVYCSASKQWFRPSKSDQKGAISIRMSVSNKIPESQSIFKPINGLYHRILKTSFIHHILRRLRLSSAGQARSGLASPSRNAIIHNSPFRLRYTSFSRSKLPLVPGTNLYHGLGGCFLQHRDRDASRLRGQDAS